MVNIRHIKKGDKVTIADLEVRAINVWLDEVIVHNGGKGTLRVDAARVIKHTPTKREFKVGDRVRHKKNGSSLQHVVVCVSEFDGEEYLWLKDVNGLGTYPSKNWVLEE